MELPLISIVTPSFNQAQFLERTIQSVFDQNYPHLEYIIMDGGSKDTSEEIIKRYANRLTYWVSQKDRGQSDAINQGFARSTGEILTWLNSDDYLMPGALAAVAAAHQKDPDAGAWVGDCLRTTEGSDERGILEANVLDFDTLGERWCDVFFGQPSCFFSRQLWRECGPLEESLHYCMDLDLWLKMLGRKRFVRVPAVLSCAPSHAEAKTVAQRNLTIAQHWLVRARHGFSRAVEREITEALEEAEANKAKILHLTQSPAYKVIRPLLKALGLVGRSVK